MKVLEEGKWKTPWSMEMVCSEKECGAKLLVEEADVKPVYNSSPAKYEAVCAVCGSKLSVPSALIPLRLKTEVDKNKMWSGSD